MKKCKIYYGTVVEGDSSWSPKGSKTVEPVRVSGYAPFGKEPDFCCKTLEHFWKEQYQIYFRENYKNKPVVQMQSVGGFPGTMNINYCPFCGAEIILIEHLKLRVIEEEEIRKTYHYQEEK